MLTIVCGEDNVTSRKYFQGVKEEYSKKNIEIRNIQPNEIEELKKWMLESLSLFSLKKAFFIENLMKFLKRSKNKKIIEQLEDITKIQDIEIVVWEDNLTSRDLKTIKGAKVKEFKPTENIFKLLDACFPTNKIHFSKILNTVSEQTDTNFIFIMLARHIRNLILIKEGTLPPKMQNWQAYKLKNQAKFWNTTKLVSYYEGLGRIEIRNKTSTNPYSIKDSLDILSCYFL